MLKNASRFISGVVVITLFYSFVSPVFAITASTGNVGDSTSQAAQATADQGTGKKDLPAVSRPSECKSQDKNVGGGGEQKKQHKTPPNCIFIEEPIGGRPGHDLFTVNCFLEAQPGKPPASNPEGCVYTLWNGEVITPPAYGPLQAILSWEPGKEDQQGFSLFYNYVGLIYKYLSGIIVGVVILFIIIGGIQMTTSAGNEQGFSAGKDRIVRALIGLVVWFLASLILYTINPTFFAF